MTESTTQTPEFSYLPGAFAEMMHLYPLLLRDCAELRVESLGANTLVVPVHQHRPLKPEPTVQLTRIDSLALFFGSKLVRVSADGPLNPEILRVLTHEIDYERVGFNLHGATTFWFERDFSRPTHHWIRDLNGEIQMIKADQVEVVRTLKPGHKWYIWKTDGGRIYEMTNADDFLTHSKEPMWTPIEAAGNDINSMFARLDSDGRPEVYAGCGAGLVCIRDMDAMMVNGANGDEVRDLRPMFDPVTGRERIHFVKRMSDTTGALWSWDFSLTKRDRGPTFHQVRFVNLPSLEAPPDSSDTTPDPALLSTAEPERPQVR